MSPSPAFSPSRRVAVLALTLFASLLSCGREITGPGGRGYLANLAFVPNYSSMIDEVDGVAHSVAGLVPFSKVRIELRRVDNTVAAAEVVDFPANATEVPLSITVRLSDAAGRDGEVLTAFLRYINASGDTVFAGGPLSVTAVPGTTGGSQQPVEIPILPTVPGAIFARVAISPDTVVGSMGQTADFTALGYDEFDVLVPNAIIGFISRNPALVSVPNLGSGSVTLNNQRGSTWLIAQSLTGVQDSAFVEVLPVPSAIEKLSGDAQTALTGEPFAQPLRIRVRAPDNLPVANWPVSFAVTSGGGSLSALADTTDANGEAEVLWTAGATPGAGSVTASIASPAIAAVFTGSQVSTLPSSLVFQTQPTDITAGASLPTINVAVRNGLDQVMSDFTGEVTLSLSGGTAGASLVGSTTVSAVAGVASFAGLSVNRGGSAYRLVATYDVLPPPQSNTFDVAAAPPTSLSILGGAGQVVPPSTELPDSIRMRLTDTFGFPVIGAAVQFTVTQGGGTVTAASVATDADGRAAVRWTVGATGPQQLRVSVGALEQFVGASIVVGGGELSLFAGLDYTLVRAGGSKAIPIFLTSPAVSPVAVTLSVPVAGEGIISWDVTTAQFNVGQSRIDVPINGLSLGTAWAVINSDVGNDSLFVTVDSSSLSFTFLDYTNFAEGDTIRTHVRITEPAPAGGLYVTLRSSNPSVALVAPSSGNGTPASGCPGDCYGGGSLRDAAELENPLSGGILAPPADTAAIFIPEGHVFGEFAVIVLDDLGAGTTVDIIGDADGFAGNLLTIDINPRLFFHYYTGVYGDPTAGLGIGQESYVYLSANYGRASRDLRFQLESSQPTRITVDSTAFVPRGDFGTNPIALRAVGVDTAWIRYSLDGVLLDSFPVRGDSARIRANASPTSLSAGGGSGQVTVRLTAISNAINYFRPSAPLNVTLTSSDTSVLVVDRGSLRLNRETESVTTWVRMVGSGNATIIVTAPGYRPDSLFYFSTVPSVSGSFGQTVGVGLMRDLFVTLPGNAVAGGTRAVSVQSLTPSLLSVLTPTLYFRQGTTSAQVRIRGNAAGAASIRFSGDGVNTTDVVVNVNPTQIVTSASGTMRADYTQRSAYAYLSDGINSHPPADTIRAVLRTSDPTVLEILDSVVTFAPTGTASFSGRYRPIGIGTAQLWVVAPGLDSTSTGTITVDSAAFERTGATVVGKNLQEYITLRRYGPDTAVAPITVQHSGPGAVLFPEMPTQFEIGQSSLFFRMVGETIGADTVTFTIPEYAPIVTTFSVETTTVTYESSWNVPTAGLSDQEVWNGFTVSGSPWSNVVGKPMSFVVRSLDTTRMVVQQDTIKWDAVGSSSPTQAATVKYLEPGFATLSITDPTGELPGDTVQVFVEPADLYGNSYSGDEVLTIGMGQRTYEYELYIQRASASGEDLWVQLTSTNPALVQVPDSVLIPAGDYYAYYVLTAGDTTGSARVTASARGYNPWHIDVLVTRSGFGMYTGGFTTGGRGWVEVFPIEALEGFNREFVNPVAARFTSSQSGLLDLTGTDFVMPAQLGYTYVPGPRGLASGTTMLTVVDNRPPAFDSVFASSRQVSIAESKIEVARQRVLITPGLLTDNFQTRFEISPNHDSVWVRYARLGTRFGIGSAALAADSVLLQSTLEQDVVTGEFVRTSYSTSVAYAMRGLGLGTDTLVVSANGFVPDTVVVSVELGVLQLTTSRLPNILVGDSLLVRVSLLDAGGQVAMAVESIAFNVSTDTTFTVPSIVTAEPGATFIEFWVHAEQANEASITISNANFRSLTLNLNAVNRP